MEKEHEGQDKSGSYVILSVRKNLLVFYYKLVIAITLLFTVKFTLLQ